jgi:anti-anti-sigma factor
MNSTNGISYAFIDDYTCLIKLVGAIKYTHVATGFEAFIEELSYKTEINNIVIDMQDCTYIDSTDLGLLARIAIYQTEKKDAPKPIIVYEKGSDIQRILEEIGFTQVFEMADSLKIGSMNLHSIKNKGMQNEIKMAKLLVASHEELVNISPDNNEKFGSFIRLMKENLEKMDSTGN